MYQWDDILIVGDSYAAYRWSPEHWPMALTLKLTGESFNEGRIPRGFGFAGAAWWSTRTGLLKELEIRVPKVLVICHTNSERLQSDYNYGLNSGSVSNSKLVNVPIGDTNYSTSVFIAAGLYYKYLHSTKFNVWAKVQWLLELDSIIKSAGIPIVIHLPCLNDFIEFSPNKFGITSEEVLYQLGLEFYKDRALDPAGLPVNHFEIPENVKMADALYDTIINFTPEQNGTIQNLNLLQQ